MHEICRRPTDHGEVKKRNFRSICVFRVHVYINHRFSGSHRCKSRAQASKSDTSDTSVSFFFRVFRVHIKFSASLRLCVYKLMRGFPRRLPAPLPLHGECRKDRRPEGESQRVGKRGYIHEVTPRVVAIAVRMLAIV